MYAVLVLIREQMTSDAATRKGADVLIDQWETVDEGELVSMIAGAMLDAAMGDNDA